MAGKLTWLLGGCGLAAVALTDVLGQAPAQSPESPPTARKHPGWFGRPPEARRPAGDRADFEKFENVRKAIDALTPEQRRRFQENLQRWGNLSPEEKKALSDRDTFRRKKIAEDIDAALKEAGLTLDGERRELFAKRYGEERHRIEEHLRKDMDEKRRPLVKEVIARLKAEFANGAPAAAVPVKQIDTTPLTTPPKP